MIIVVTCLAVVALEAVVLRGRLARLTSLKLRRFYLVWLALVDQIVVISVLPGSLHDLLDVANIVSYAAAGLFVWSNRRIPGVVVVATGGALNVAAMAANHGTMPASATALAASGWRPEPGHFVNSAVVSHPKLAMLGDIFSTPRWLPGHDVFSIGDVLVVAGVAILIYRVCAVPEPSEQERVPAEVGPRDAARHVGEQPRGIEERTVQASAP